MSQIRYTYKDSLFRHLFGSEERKANALELYNALAGKCYDDPDELEITTIGDAVFLGRQNDVSFLISDEMVMIEHQSTHNPNMPLRGLLYFSQLYNKYIAARHLDIYGESLRRLPTPRYIVLYFGERELDDRMTMRLSDSFVAGPGDLEVRATVFNCNEGRNRAIMQACDALRGYSHLLALAREGEKAGLDTASAVRAAVGQCISESVLEDYLTEHRAEVEQMLFTIQDEERAMRVHEETIEREARERGMEAGLAEGRAQGLTEGRAEGRAKGHAEGRAEGLAEGRKETLATSLKALMESAGCNAETAMDMLQIPAEERPALMEALSQRAL